MDVARYFGDNFKLHIAHNTDDILKTSKKDNEQNHYTHSTTSKYDQTCNRTIFQKT